MVGNNGAVNVSVSLYPLDVALIGYVRRDLCLATNDSAAVRFMMRDWALNRGLKVAEILGGGDGERVRMVDPEAAATH